MIDQVARVPRLLVACDFDGTLAPIVDHPDDAVALPEAEASLRRLASIPNTWAAIVSGRRRSDLVDRFGQGRLILVGEHGADWGEDDPADPAALLRARRFVAETAALTPGAIVEQKARSVTFHYRLAPDPDAVVEKLLRWTETEADIELLEGKAVLEFTVSPARKGDAVAALRRELEADAVVFLGDDSTDESVFETLEPTDLGVHIGPGASAATERLALPDDVAAFLTQIADLRDGA